MPYSIPEDKLSIINTGKIHYTSHILKKNKNDIDTYMATSVA